MMVANAFVLLVAAAAALGLIGGVGAFSLVLTALCMYLLFGGQR